jgi:hypothetical protein
MSSHPRLALFFSTAHALLCYSSDALSIVSVCQLTQGLAGSTTDICCTKMCRVLPQQESPATLDMTEYSIDHAIECGRQNALD